MKILILNGPNLNLLGLRKPDVYGHKNLDEINAFIKDYFKRVDFEFFQSNHEGELIEKLQQAANSFNGVVMNAGAFTHYSIAIRDAIEAISIPVAEVHISNVDGREGFRRLSVISEVCAGTVSGFGIYGYIMAAQALVHQLKRKPE